MADDAEVISTVEWGASPPERQTWMDRLTAGGAPLSLEPPAPRFRPNYLALGLGLAGFLVAAGALYMPWIHLGSDRARTLSNPTGGLDVHLSMLPAGATIIYGFSLTLGLGLLGLLLFVETQRRLVAAATIGILAGNALALVTLSTSVETVEGDFGFVDPATATGGLTSGFYLAVAALLLLAAAAFAAALPRRSRSTRENVQEMEEPMEFTVTGLGSDIG